MNRQEPEHIVRAAAGITDETEFIIIGSQSILGKFPDAPRSLRQSMEADIYPKARPELAELISGCLGEYSPFHRTFAYYAEGVAPDTPKLSIGWEDRLVRFSNENTHGATACCLDPIDLAYAKLAAGRPKDIDFVVELTRCNLINPSTLAQLIRQAEDPALKKTMTERWQMVQTKTKVIRQSSQSIGGRMKM
jgi:hypothetical protein